MRGATEARRPGGVRPDARAFLPAALEIHATPPAWQGRALIAAIMLLVAAALAWSLLARVDVVATASGRVIPGARSSIVQAPDPGVVSVLRVREGARVAGGDVLLELDARELRTERARIAGEQAAEQANHVTMRAFRMLLAEDATAPGPAAALRAALRESGVQLDTAQQARQRERLAARIDEYRRKRDVLGLQTVALRAERRALEVLVRKLGQALPVRGERAQSAAQLQARGLVARQQWLELELERSDAEHELEASRARVHAIDGQVAALEADSAALAASELRAAFEAQESAARNAAVLARELERLDARIARRVVRAPLAGSVQQLAVRAAGAVVAAGDALLVIVPRDPDLEIEAFVSNRDIGFVDAGQPAAVKVDAFEFTRHGLLPARVRALAAEAVEDARGALVYPARIALARDFFDLGTRRAVLAPGMAVQVEIHIGRRRVVDYFLSPLARAARDSLRER